MKKTITEITEKFGTDGKIIERVTKTTTEESCETLSPYSHGISTGTGTGMTNPYYSTTTAQL